MDSLLSLILLIICKKIDEDLQPVAGAHNTIQKGVWSYKEKDNSGSQYYGEVKWEILGTYISF